LTRPSKAVGGVKSTTGKRHWLAELRQETGVLHEISGIKERTCEGGPVRCQEKPERINKRCAPQKRKKAKKQASAKKGARRGHKKKLRF